MSRNAPLFVGNVAIPGCCEGQDHKGLNYKVTRIRNKRVFLILIVLSSFLFLYYKVKSG